ncbi:MAG: GntR family transcriptional regulator [Chloroflexi bacterium]|nr:MAG: GntR family transcriptional regulator [Chloroflexota bacterium]MBL1197141.1 GntR family transcriptional regulator [Chloroflexota bacterium]NOH14436.1 GntR family transcriptional regulator [Chloroflexota bacterium]
MTEITQAGKALYQAVADSLMQQIQNGELQPNERIPSESELGTIFGVGRNTVRHAISDLVNQGVLRTVQGVGTFVADARYVKTAEYLYGMSQEMEMHGVEISSRVLQAELIEADAFLARRLQLQLGAEVVFLYRLRMMDGVPTGLERAYLPHELCLNILDEHDFSKESLYGVLSTNYGARPDHAEQEIEAKLATDEVARMLELEQPAVVLVFHRSTHLADGRVIEYVDSELRADRYRFNANLRLHSPLNDFVFERRPVKATEQD